MIEGSVWPAAMAEKMKAARPVGADYERPSLRGLGVLSKAATQSTGHEKRIDDAVW